MKNEYIKNEMIMDEAIASAELAGAVPVERMESKTRPTEEQQPLEDSPWETGIRRGAVIKSTVGQQPAEEIWPKWQQVIRENLVWYREGEKDHGDLVIAEEAIIREVKSLLSQARQQGYEEGWRDCQDFK
jgi:hypothetical protein